MYRRHSGLAIEFGDAQWSRDRLTVLCVSGTAAWCSPRRVLPRTPRPLAAISGARTARSPCARARRVAYRSPYSEFGLTTMGAWRAARAPRAGRRAGRVRRAGRGVRAGALPRLHFWTRRDVPRGGLRRLDARLGGARLPCAAPCSLLAPRWPQYFMAASAPTRSPRALRGPRTPEPPAGARQAPPTVRNVVRTAAISISTVKRTREKHFKGAK